MLGQMKRKWEERVKKVEELASHYERNPLPTVYRPRLSKPFQPSRVWKIFCRQAEAFRFVKTCKEDVHVFALEKNTQNGQRFYLVTTYKELWHYYTKGYKTSLMHCYEVIPEKDACKLYFDLEFYKAANPGADGKDMVAKLIELVSQKLKELYDVNCSARDVLNLDSSTDEKFSRHLIFLPCKTVFKDNIHVGVYTRNRNFRMYKSSKAGKNVILKIAEDNKFVPNCEENISLEEAYFLSSLVCNVRCKDGTKILSSSFLEEERKMSGFLKSKATRSTRESQEGRQDSPYPEIDCFVRSLINKDGVQGGIRQWNYFSGEEILVYDICGYRWCENIGRAHRSNNIMILVDLKKEVWYQKCHDPVCREKNFKSQSFPLPPGIRLSSLFIEEEDYTVTNEHENTEEKVTSHSNPADLESSASLEESTSQDAQWDDASDDAYLVETTEDVELAEAANDSLGYDTEEIPDEVLLEISWKQDTCNKDDS
ncbi:DNA-directed primase/polymerase protein isoform X3 [Numida meleagris]|uniref:DNA-directed primase/polymerase protein isoform X3 n=1 Tax=Numida meleagris TaxID=8996 RepID=UPI000B3DCF43|nr:DNA-directed primase/polymerase protein isoform X3 [Numida meleagris]